MKNGEYYQLAELLSNRNNLHIIFAKSREKDNSSIFEKNDFCRIIDKQKSRGTPLLLLLNRLNYQMVIRLLGSIYILSVGLTSKASYHSAKFLG